MRKFLAWVNLSLTKGPPSAVNQANAAEVSDPVEKPVDVGEILRLGRAALAAGDLRAATGRYRDIVSLDASRPEHHTALAYVLTEQGLFEEAWPHLEQAMHLRPEDPDIHFQRGNFQLAVGELANARRCYQAALALRPDYAEVHSSLGHVHEREGSMEDAIASFDKALLFDTGYFPAHSNLLWALSFQLDDGAGRYLAEARKFGQKVLSRATPYRAWRCQEGQGGAPKKLRIGLVSGDFRQHPVGIFLEGVVAQLSAQKLELLAYSMNPQDDPLTERIRGHFSAWTTITQMSDEEAAGRIHADGVDVLIDLAGHGAGNRLPVFAWKPAPVQVNWLGHLASTGVPGMDYVLADPVSTPNSVSAQFTEQVWHLPQTLFCFTPPVDQSMLAVAPLPALRNGYITFGSFQRLNKLSNATLELWGRVFRALPQARLYLRNEGMNREATRAALLERLAQAGIVAARVTFGGHVPRWEEYLAMYREVDVMLDTFPHPGVTTTCEALWMGVPTVTLARGATLGRIGASLMTCAGLAEWVAWSEEEFVLLAVKRSAGIEALALLRAGLRQQVAKTPLFDAGRFGPQFEEALFARWQRKMACSTG